jgi:hypothetical protein
MSVGRGPRPPFAAEEVAMIVEYFGSRQGHPRCSPGI